MPNYQNGKIYKIRSEIGNCQYYGSTTNKYLCNRLASHKQQLSRGGTITSKEVLKYDDAVISLIELYPCNSKLELNSRERYYIENNDCVNKYIPTRTKKEWIDDNKENIKHKKKEYYINNKNKIEHKKKEWRTQNKEKVKSYSKTNYIKNKKKKKEYGVQYREKKKEQRFICECGKSVSVLNGNHKKTNYHKNNIKQ